MLVACRLIGGPRKEFFATASEDEALLLMRIHRLVGICRACRNAQSLDSLRHEFDNPPKAMRPMVRWWWPGKTRSGQDLTWRILGAPGRG